MGCLFYSSIFWSQEEISVIATGPNDISQIMSPGWPQNSSYCQPEPGIHCPKENGVSDIEKLKFICKDQYDSWAIILTFLFRRACDEEY